MRVLPAVLGLAVALGFAPAASAATTVVVAKDGSGNYTSVQAAINAVSGGSVIKIKAGTYNETIIVPAGKSGLTIEGATGNAEDVVIAAGYAAWMTKPDGTTYGTEGSATATI